MKWFCEKKWLVLLVACGAHFLLWGQEHEVLLSGDGGSIQGYEVSEPYKSMRTLPFVEHGWFSIENRNNLERLIRQYNPHIIVELGSWLGSSALFMAAQLKFDDKLYAVDTWQGSVEHENNPAWAQFLPTLYAQFLSNVKHKRLAHIIVPVKMTTLEAARDLEVFPDLIYVDASHEEEAVYHDIMAWYAKLRVGGTMCGDDWFFWPSVRSGVQRAAAELKQHINTETSFWWFDPKI